VHHELLGHIQLAVFRFNLQNVASMETPSTLAAES